MSLGSFTLACLLLTANADAPEAWHYNDKQLQIPIRINPERQADIRELVLFVSRDEGKTWQEAVKAKPDQEGFPFLAAQDGPYWFKVAIVNQQGVQEPADINQAPVGQRLIIDTIKPAVKIQSAERSGGEVIVRWDAQDANADMTTVKLEYRTATSAPGLWSPAPILPTQRETRFSVVSQDAVSIRLTMKDLAGNEGFDKYELTGAGALPGGNTVTGYSPPAPSPLPHDVKPGGDPNPYLLNQGPGFNSNVQVPPGPNHTQPLETQSVVPIVASGTDTINANTTPLNPNVTTTNPPVGEQPSPNNIYSSNPLPGPVPPTRVINQMQVKLEFEVTDVGPSGLGTVDVFLTTDGGRTWERFLADARPVFPSTGNVPSGQPVQGAVVLNLPREGFTYGIWLVVKSRAGLGITPPQPGDTPQMMVEVDTAMPEAQLYRPTADPSNPDALMLKWAAKDRKLANNPISMEWAASREGPWQFIGGPELPNTGTYSWSPPRDIPPHVFLKLTVRDSAGNTAVAVTPQPVLVDLKRPKARITGLTVGGER